jgi:DtxR family Mn-dependent transcriptional regulator
MTARREDQEEFLELCWTAEEEGLHWVNRDQLPAHLTCFLPHPIEGDGFGPEAVDALLAERLLEADDRRVRLTDAGRRQAAEIVRRHRLTEVLLHNVLAVSEQSVESTACQVEHILNAEVTEAVCAFLGHPPSCPHGPSIPRGRCCEQEPAHLQPLIAALAELAVGETATVAFIHSRRHAYLQRLSALGVVPGSRIRLRQRHPAFVLQIGETELALDHEAGREIFIRRTSAKAQVPP